MVLLLWPVQEMEEIRSDQAFRLNSVSQRTLKCSNTGTLYIADAGIHVIKRIGLNSMVTILAGNSVAGFKDGMSVSSQLNTPTALAFQGDTGLSIADMCNHAVRLLNFKFSFRVL